MMISITESGSRVNVLARLAAKVETHKGVDKDVVKLILEAVEKETPADAAEVSVSLNLYTHFHCAPKEDGQREVGP